MGCDIDPATAAAQPFAVRMGGLWLANGRTNRQRGSALRAGKAKARHVMDGTATHGIGPG